MLELLRVSSLFPRLAGALDVSPPRIGRKVIPRKSVFRFAPDRRTTVVYEGSVLTCFFQDPCLSVGTQFPADLPLFLPTVRVSEGWSRKCAKHVS